MPVIPKPRPSTGMAWVDALVRAMQDASLRDPTGGLAPAPMAGPAVLVGPAAPWFRAVARRLAAFLHRRPELVHVSRGPLETVPELFLRGALAEAGGDPAGALVSLWRSAGVTAPVYARGPRPDVAIWFNTTARANTPQLPYHEGLHAAHILTKGAGVPAEKYVPTLYEHYLRIYPDLEEFASRYGAGSDIGRLEAVIEGMARRAARVPPTAP